MIIIQAATPSRALFFPTHLNLGSSQLDGRSTKLDSGSTRLNFISFFISQEGTPLGGGGSLNSRGTGTQNKPPQAQCMQGLGYLFPPSHKGRPGNGILTSRQSSCH